MQIFVYSSQKELASARGNYQPLNVLRLQVVQLPRDQLGKRQHQLNREPRAERAENLLQQKRSAQHIQRVREKTRKGLWKRRVFQFQFHDEILHTQFGQRELHC